MDIGRMDLKSKRNGGLDDVDLFGRWTRATLGDAVGFQMVFHQPRCYRGKAAQSFREVYREREGRGLRVMYQQVGHVQH